MEIERKCLVSIRQPGEDYPRRAVVVAVGKRRETALVETGIKGKGVVERVSLNRIFHVFGRVQ